MENFKTYSDLTAALDNEYNRFICFLEYDDFLVIYDTEKYKYYYVEKDENDAVFYCEVIPVAELSYDVTHDIKVNEEAAYIMSRLFDCYCCGEYVSDNCIKYLWFERI